MARTIGSHGPKTMEAIRKAGLRLIFEHGYAAMSLRQLAAEVGIQSGSLYNHISTKQELLFTLVRDHINLTGQSPLTGPNARCKALSGQPTSCVRSSPSTSPTT